MRKKWNIFFIGIVLLTALSLVINLAQPYTIAIDKPFSLHYTFAGINPSFSLGPVHFQKDLSLRKGLDLQGGTSITLQADMRGIPQAEQQNALDSAQAVIERRVNFFGGSEPLGQTHKVTGYSRT